MTFTQLELQWMLEEIIEAIERGDPQEIADIALRYKKWLDTSKEKQNAN
jgi:hypothetical protein